MSFEPRVVHPAEELESPSIAMDGGACVLPAAHAAAVDASLANANARFDSAASEADELSPELAVLAKQLNLESVRLAKLYPAVADDEAFLNKLIAAEAAPAPAGLRKFLFGRLLNTRSWFRSAAALLVAGLGVTFLITGPAPVSITAPADSAAQNQSLPLSGQLHDVLNVPMRPASFSIHGLSGEEIEGLKAFERPGTRVSL